jgi:hypothetical protein
MTRRFPAALAAVALAVTPAAVASAGPPPSEPPKVPAAKPATAPEVVSLRFAWPAKLEAQVTSRRTRTRTGKAASVMTTTYVQRAIRQGETTRITTSDSKVSGDHPFAALVPGPGGEAIARELAKVGDEIVEVVSAEGELVALDGVEKLGPALRKAFDAALAQGPDGKPAPAEVKAAAGRAIEMAETAARSEAQESWSLAVGFWNGADLDLGEAYATETEAEIPVLPGTTAAYALEFAVKRRVPCAEAERENRCVELAFTSRPHPEVLPQITKALMQKIAGTAAKVPDDAITAVEIENALLLVTEPATLVPHRFHWKQTVRITGNDGGKAHTSEQTDEKLYVYRYAAAKR